MNVKKLNKAKSINRAKLIQKLKEVLLKESFSIQKDNGNPKIDVFCFTAIMEICQYIHYDHTLINAALTELFAENKIDIEKDTDNNIISITLKQSTIDELKQYNLSFKQRLIKYRSDILATIAIIISIIALFKN